MSTRATPRPPGCVGGGCLMIGRSRAQSRTSTRARSALTWMMRETGGTACATAFVTTSLTSKIITLRVSPSIPASVSRSWAHRRAGAIAAKCGSISSACCMRSLPPVPSGTVCGPSDRIRDRCHRVEPRVSWDTGRRNSRDGCRGLVVGRSGGASPGQTAGVPYGGDTRGPDFAGSRDFRHDSLRLTMSRRTAGTVSPQLAATSLPWRDPMKGIACRSTALTSSRPSPPRLT